MSAIETVPKNPLEDAKGLSRVENEELIEFEQHRRRAHERHERNKQTGLPGRLTFRSIGTVIAHGMDELETVHTDEVATKRYRRREGAYQEQAVKDAAAEGVHTDYGT